jgi:hypothetical protein
MSIGIGCSRFGDGYDCERIDCLGVRLRLFWVGVSCRCVLVILILGN